MCIIASIFTTITFFINDTATTEIYTLSLHDALPIYTFGQLIYLILIESNVEAQVEVPILGAERRSIECQLETVVDRKSTRLNSSHANISYAVFCLKK